MSTTTASYAIIALGGKQYRVREGERLLVDRLAVEDGKTFSPNVLLVGGDGGPQLSPEGVVVTAKVLGQQRGPKIRIGKYKKRTGYKRHTGFRAALTQIEIESIGDGKTRAAARPKAKPTAEPKAEAGEAVAAPAETEAIETAIEIPGNLPAGYTELTVAALKEAVTGWDDEALVAALEYELAHGNRKGAIAAIEAARQGKEG